jgi:hypothetical protein
MFAGQLAFTIASAFTGGATYVNVGGALGLVAFTLN